MKRSTDYPSLIQSVPTYRTILTKNNQFRTYDTLVIEACRVCSPSPKPAASSVAWTKAASMHDQLVWFLAFSGISCVPVIVSVDMKHVPEPLITEEIPTGACTGMLTFGSTGQPKLRFHTLDSWISFFPIQDTTFGMTTQTRPFVQGSLALTGNLNLYLSLLSLGVSTITAFHINPSIWCREIEFYHVDALYLIPSKSRLLTKYVSHPSLDIRTILVGSQNPGHGDTVLLRAAHPDSYCFLYYGVNGLGYVTWLIDQEMNDDPARIGKPFPGVGTALCNSEIYVDTSYSAVGITGPYSAGDTGYMDRDGYLYSNGRRDNVYSIYGSKASTVKIENTLNSLPQVQKTAVIFENSALRTHAILPVLTPSGQDTVALHRVIKKELKDYLESWEIPRDIVFHENLPKSNSRKTVRGLFLAKGLTTI